MILVSVPEMINAHTEKIYQMDIVDQQTCYIVQCLVSTTGLGQVLLLWFLHIHMGSISEGGSSKSVSWKSGKISSNTKIK